MPIFINNIKSLNFTEIESNKRYCLNQIEAKLGVESENNKEYFYLSLSWEQDSICRKIHVNRLNVS